ncbi:MAG: deoxyribodipyrimidine photo-lyase [Bacteroidia bacterium]
MQTVSVFWFRRDLRLDDNAALYRALTQDKNVLPLFIFDKDILDDLPNKDARVEFIHATVNSIKSKLAGMGADMLVKYGKPIDIWKELFSRFKITSIYTNHDFETYAIIRDQEINDLALRNGATFNSFKDHVIFEKEEVVKDDGKPYTVFTPYSKKWKKKLNDYYLKSYPTENYFDNLLRTKIDEFPSLESMGFSKTDIKMPSIEVAEQIINSYDKTRDFPAQKGTTRLGLHLRFGTISIRKLAQRAVKLNETYLNELIWRDFYAMILCHFPKVETESFKKQYEQIPWRNDKSEFESWCRGQTGYPIVDAGMRELNATGFMHNRVRMITASFLTKHLLIDWRWGEAYFAQKLLDFDLASNNGGWQWAASSGCDAAPYFRVFNPELQTKKFDPDLKYIRKWVPEFQSLSYPKPIVNHKMARERVLKTYKEALS